MAADEHKKLANFIKNVHSELRKMTVDSDAESAWKEHCAKTSMLQEYAQCMEKLATTFWKENSADTMKMANSRIDWVVKYCLEYYLNGLYLIYRIKESEIADKIGLSFHENHRVVNDKIKLLDVGSCYNPFKECEHLEVLALDLCPANENVHKCDFLNVAIGEQTCCTNNVITELQADSFDVVTFCFLLEYLPTSKLRIEACKRAYSLLRTEGLLVIATPDSKHVGANCRIMKCWRYTLARLGFSRIQYNKFPHMHCMAFRKSLHEEIASRWATLHQESYMSFELNIPQDFKKEETILDSLETQHSDDGSVLKLFKELPQIDNE